MLLERAIEILERLRDGEDPVSGKPLPAANPAQSPDVVRALYTVLAALPGDGGESSCEGAKLPKPKRPQPSRAGKPWTDEDDAKLGSAFDEGRTVSSLSKDLGRSSAAVRLRLVKLGRLSAEDVLLSRGRREPAPAG